jgi:phage N-6-adenine-methyltransferase
MEKVMFASKNTDWETPDWLFDRLNQEFEFDLDVCATHLNSKVDNYFSPQDDALKHNWFGTCWMNPPYGREIGQWMCHALRQATEGNCAVVCLVPAKPDTKWWWVYAKEGEVRFLRGRLKFKGAEHSAPFPSAIVVFRRHMELGNGTTRYWEIKDDSSDG